MSDIRALEAKVQDLPADFKVRMTGVNDEFALKETLVSEIVYNSRYYDEIAIDPSHLVIEDGECDGEFKTFRISLKEPRSA